MRNAGFFYLLAAACALMTGAMAEQTRPLARTTDPVELVLASVVGAITETQPEQVALPEIVAPAAPTVGPETNLPMPRYVSLKADEGNLRRGPSLSHRIDWVLLQRGMPLQVTAEYGHWRRVSDRDGISGWLHYSLISGTRTVLIEQDMLTLRTSPDDSGRDVVRLAMGVIARLGDCEIDWCKVSADGYNGWALKTALWGVESDEIRD